MRTLTLTLAPPDQAAPEGDLNLRLIERAAIQTALERTGGRRDAAAKLLGIDRKTLYRNMTWEHDFACESCGKKG